MTDSPEQEHSQLLEETAALEAAHKLLESRPDDLAGHREHVERLHRHIARLHDYMRRRGFQVSARRAARVEKVSSGE